ncbi:MAG: twin-arginine translocase TatA/TatE family subunit [Luteolibacter sp.]|jgi:TatA/E family protein of Tat protein translocase
MSTSLLGFLGPIGGPEMIMIFVVILLLFGAKKLPELARGVGKSMGEFKKAREEFEREITRSEDEVRRDDSDKETRVKPAPDKESHDA